MHVERLNSSDLVVNGLPDGSRVIVNSNNETVFALNPTAGAAWDACSSPTTLSKVTEEMQRSFDASVTEELAEQAILQLKEKKLVSVSGLFPKTTRREVLAGLSAVALPLVVSLTVGEQKAHADHARSNDEHEHSFEARPRASDPKHKSLKH
jgi:Coenzyme PQQ synthesis protein D (PqqD)